MSSIDKYSHKIIGFIECPSDYNLVYKNKIKKLPIYQLKQDIPNDEIDFDGKTGDLIIGGGSGEAPAFRISYPEAVYFFKKKNWDDFENYDEIFKSFWTSTFAYKIGTGFVKIGWNPYTELEFWFSSLIIDKLLDNGKISFNKSSD